MTAKAMEARLLAAFAEDPALTALGGEALAADGGGVAIERRGHHVALWRWNNGMFSMILAGYAESTAELETVAEVVQFTRARFF